MLKRYYKSGILEAGCDEAGRGCLAGPVYAAAVILPAGFELPLLNDSKKLSSRKRAVLRPLIEQQAIAYAVSSCTNEEIDRLNILKASLTAMQKAVEQLYPQPELLLIDGNTYMQYSPVPFHCIAGGDSKFASIAAASILAKTYRDEYMEKIHAEFPYFNWHKNKGYPTKEHRTALMQHGPTKYHRKSFHLHAKQLKLPFLPGRSS